MLIFVTIWEIIFVLSLMSLIALALIDSDKEWAFISVEIVQWVMFLSICNTIIGLIVCLFIC